MKKIYKMNQINEIHEKDSIMKNKITNITFLNSIFCFNQLIILLLKLIIYIQMFIKVLPRENNQFDQRDSHSSYITLSIKQGGNQKILGDNFEILPDEIYVNENNVSGEICKSLFLNETSNRIKLVWRNEITNVSYMFSELNNIGEIDLSFFNSSLVTSMYHMFSGCTNLAAINFF